VLRHDPIVDFVGRKLKVPYELKGYVIPAGAHVALGTTMLHYRPDLFPDPHAFKPERFLGRTSPARFFEFTPFGGGVRRCIGATFAVFEMKEVLVALLQACRFDFLTRGTVRPTWKIFHIGPNRPILLRLAERRSRAQAS
jgi:cytochrome P450